MPVVIIAGEEDQLVDTDAQSARLHADVSQSTFHRIAGSVDFRNGRLTGLLSDIGTFDPSYLHLRKPPAI